MRLAMVTNVENACVMYERLTKLDDYSLYARFLGNLGTIVSEYPTLKDRVELGKTRLAESRNTLADEADRQQQDEKIRSSTARWLSSPEAAWLCPRSI